MLLRSIIRQINVLNIVLLAGIIALAVSISSPLLTVRANYTLPSPRKVLEENGEKPAEPQAPSVTDYTVVAEQNVFSPERKIPAEKKDEKPLPKPEFVLYGTLITADTSLAFLEDLKAPYTTASRGKRQRTLRLGAAVSGFTLSEIHPDHVVMARGEERVEVLLFDPSKPKRHEAGAALAAAGTTPAPAQKARGQGLPPLIQRQIAGQPPGVVGAPDDKKTLKSQMKELERRRGR